MLRHVLLRTGSSWNSYIHMVTINNFEMPNRATSSRKTIKLKYILIDFFFPVGVGVKMRIESSTS